ncbi:unnamed protein product [Allacma fusca]|uniref:Transposase n=1 Tax=Allacma fusca TaxID=39272 RepID=A0A8J2NLE0_9HEXA|nr:unnamed protein product [Allacma fusca]
MLNRKRPQGEKKTRFWENLQTVTRLLVHDPEKSTRRLAYETGIAKTTVQRLIKDSGLRVTRPTRVQQLKPEDYPKRIQFSNEMIARFQADDNLVDNIMWTDDGGIIGPYFFESTVDGKAYIKLLQEFARPSLEQHNLMGTIYWQQDGAPAHWAKVVREFLNQTFDRNWIGSDGPSNWPPRSPDLTVPDFWLWGRIKQKVFAKDMKTNEELKAAIKFEIESLCPQEITRACQRVPHRLKRCLENDGGNIVYE